MKYNEKKLKEIILKTIISPLQLNELIDNVSKSKIFSELTQDDVYLEKLKRYFVCIEKEMIPVNNLAELKNLDDADNDEKIFNIYTLYKKGILADKEELIIEKYNFKLYYNTKKFESYKDENNIKNEINRIIRYIDTDDIFKKFLEKLHIENPYSFFLTINDNLAEIFKSEYLGLFSALLNYSKLDIERIILDDDKNFFSLFNLNENIDNWDILSNIFKKILKEIDIRNNSLLRRING